jgi:hypothetical protein
LVTQDFSEPCQAALLFFELYPGRPLGGLVDKSRE